MILLVLHSLGQKKYGGVAQGLEQGPFKLRVEGSSPSGGAIRQAHGLQPRSKRMS